MSTNTGKLRSTVENKPVALAAAIRTLLYTFSAPASTRER